MYRNTFGILIATGLMICTPGCRKIGSGNRTYVPFATVSERQPVDTTVTNLRVSTVVGTVRIIGSNIDEVRVEADVKLEQDRADKETEPGKFADHVRLEMQSGVLTVADAHMDQPDTSDWRVSLTVHVPARLAATAVVTAGSLAVEGMTSDLNLKNDAGEIRVAAERIGNVSARAAAGLIDLRAAAVDGSVSASADVGSVKLHIADSAPTGDVTLEAQAGDIVLELPKGATGTFRAHSSVGIVSFAEPMGIAVTRSGLGARAEGTVGEGGPTYTLTANVGA
ncbi:MAG: DUF4097 family beta strand repeat protein, partial [bacterium]|nr:DUF4097 family beta strand repeat protein [bacterium]